MKSLKHIIPYLVATLMLFAGGILTTFAAPGDPIEPLVNPGNATQSIRGLSVGQGSILGVNFCDSKTTQQSCSLAGCDWVDNQCNGLPVGLDVSGSGNNTILDDVDSLNIIAGNWFSQGLTYLGSTVENASAWILGNPVTRVPLNLPANTLNIDGSVLSTSLANSSDQRLCVGKEGILLLCGGQIDAQWYVGGWGACNPPEYEQVRQVNCTRGETIVDDSQCGTEKPNTTKSCFTYTWKLQEWGSCEEQNTGACVGANYTTPNASCTSSTPGSPCDEYDGYLCSKDTVNNCSLTSSSTTTASCGDLDQVSCISGSYSQCTWQWKQGGGTPIETQSVACIGSDGKQYDDTFCSSEEKPLKTRPCTLYAWEVSDLTWGTCKDTPAGAQQTRNVRCLGSDGSTHPESFCTGEKPSTTRSCITFDWNTTSWGSCSGNNETRTVTCRGSDGRTYVDANCDGAKPSSSRFAQRCVTYSWNAGSWGSCSGNNETRTVTCRGSDNKTYSDSSCSGSKPATSQFAQRCVTYSWQTGSWGSCNGNNQSRSVTCEGSDGKVYNASQCSGTKPATTQFNQACVTYSWNTGSWGSCSGNNQTRTVTCRGSDGKTYTDSSCSGTKPATSQFAQSCVSYSWQTGSWGSCSGNNQFRTVTCRGTDGKTYNDSSCSGTKPATSQFNQACVTYSYEVGSWGSCSGNNQYRTVTCKGSDGKTYNDSSCAGSKPATSQFNQACVTYSWQTGSWGSCSGNNQFRTVTCRGSDNKTYSDGNCSGTKPATSQFNQACVTYSWQTGSWGSCSGNNQFRTVTCRGSDNKTYNDSSCSGTKPATSQFNQACVSYSYEVGSWGSCSTGSRTRSRTVTCRGSDGKTYNDSSCGAAPSRTESCDPYAGYVWETGQWGPCTVFNGNYTQNRTLVCRNNNAGGVIVDDSRCDPFAQPYISQSCEPSYRGLWTSEPSGICGTGGTEYYHVRCVDIETGIPTTNSNCNPADKPPSIQPSYTCGNSGGGSFGGGGGGSCIDCVQNPVGPAPVEDPFSPSSPFDSPFGF